LDINAEKRPEESMMFDGGLPQSFGHAVTGQLESNRTLKMFKLQPQRNVFRQSKLETIRDLKPLLRTVLPPGEYKGLNDISMAKNPR